jgi:hypothetical protein
MLLKPAQLQAMKTTVSERTGKPVTTGAGYGLGIGRTGSACGAWGHSGELLGYDVSTAFSEDGRHQAILMMNQDATTLPKPAFALYKPAPRKSILRLIVGRDAPQRPPEGTPWRLVPAMSERLIIPVSRRTRLVK